MMGSKIARRAPAKMKPSLVQMYSVGASRILKPELNCMGVCRIWRLDGSPIGPPAWVSGMTLSQMDLSYRGQRIGV